MHRGSALLLLGFALVSGCAGHHDTTQPASPSMVINRPTLIYNEVTPGAGVPVGEDVLAGVDVLEMVGPANGFGDDARFWRQLRPLDADPRRQRMLQANGIQAGISEVDAWGNLKKVIDQYPFVTSQPHGLRGTAPTELPAGTPQVTQTLFYFTADGDLRGRTSEDSENFWGIAYAADPAKAGAVRIDICPGIRGTRRHLQVTPRGTGEYEFEYVQPEAFYDLGLQLSLATGAVLIIAPTSQALTTESSLGNLFLVERRPEGMREHVLVFIPRLFHFDRKATEKQLAEFEKHERRTQGTAEKPR